MPGKFQKLMYEWNCNQIKLFFVYAQKNAGFPVAFAAIWMYVVAILFGL